MIRKGTTNVKARRGRPPKKKVLESFVEKEPILAPAPIAPVKKCECGKDVHPGTHQCWDCSHRK